jgi:drug/metabolite transporter (DMT)-like permease
MLRKRTLRRVTGSLLVVAGAITMWLAPESISGAVLLVAAIALEALGLGVEHSASREKDNTHAMDR